MDKFLEEVPLDRVVAGYRRTVRGLRANRIRCVLIARDADDHIASEIKRLCSEKNIPFRVASSKREMGEKLFLDVGCAVCGEAVDNAKF